MEAKPTPPAVDIELFAIPFACSLAAHISLREAALPHRCCWVTPTSLIMADGGHLSSVNIKGKVPALRLEDGTLLTENTSVLLYIAQHTRTRPLAPLPQDTAARFKTYEWLSFVGTELHKQTLAPWFDVAAPETTKADVCARHLPWVLRHVERTLDASPFLVGSRFSVADAYLFWALLLVPQLGVSLDDHPSLKRFFETMRDTTSVKDALRAERRAMTTLAAPTHKPAPKEA